MRRPTAVLIACVVVAAGLLAASAAADRRAHSATLPTTVVSLTFDDNPASHVAVGAMLDARGMHGTFYVNWDFLRPGPDDGDPYYMTRDDVRSLHERGHEIAAHTLRHVDLTMLTLDDARAAVCDDRDELVAQGFGPVVSFAYPHGHVSPTAQQAVRDCDFLSARGLGGLGSAFAETMPPADAWNLRTPEYARVDTTLADLQQAVLDAEAHGGGWVVIVFHGICDDECTSVNSFPTAPFAAFLDWLAQREDDGTVVRTVREVMTAPTPPPTTTTTTTTTTRPTTTTTRPTTTTTRPTTTTTTTTTSPPTTSTTAPSTPGTGGGDAPVDAGPPPGYWTVTADGAVHAFGEARLLGDARARVRPLERNGVSVVDIAPTPSGDGYWLVDNRGTVDAFGDARPDLGGADLGPAPRAGGEQVTSLSPTPTGNGYWLFTDRGRVIARGDAAHFGDVSTLALNGPVLDSIPTPTGLGYYLVAADGGIFAFGDARFRGSMGGHRLAAPVQSIVPTRSNGGYWLVASDGGVFAFGDAGFAGSVPGALRPGQRLNAPITGMVRYGDGYLMVAEDGGIFAFSSLPFLGSLGAAPPDRPVVAVAANRS